MSGEFWVNGPPVLDPTVLSTRHLIELWHANRNRAIGMTAADEVCRRVELSQWDYDKQPLSKRREG